MRKVVIVQARMGSTRLPGKVMINIKGKTVLEHVIERIKFSKCVDEIIIATSIDKNNDVIEKECNKLKVKCFRGSEEDVLARYYCAAKDNNGDLIIRITCDCPLIDYRIIDNMLKKFIDEDKNKSIDYMSNFDILENTFPRGMDVEIIKMNALEKTFNEAKKKYEREHVTPYIYGNPNKFNLLGYLNDEDLSEYRFTLDTKEDLKLIEIIYDNLYSINTKFGMKEIVEFIDENSNLKKINEDIIQKKLED